MYEELKSAIEKLKQQLPAETKAWLALQAVENARRTVEMCLRQTDFCDLASLETNRNGCTLTIKWDVKGVADPSKIMVFGQLFDIPHSPEPDALPNTMIHYGSGHGSMTLNLEEGHAYLFQFFFFKDHNPIPQEKWFTGSNIPGCIIFRVGVPLSEKSKEVLAQADSLMSDPSELARHELEKFRKLENTLDEMLREATEQIKAMKLAPEEEEEKIEAVREKCIEIRDKLKG